MENPNVLSNDRVTSILEHVPCDAKEEDLIRAGYHSRDAEISEHHIVIKNLRAALVAEHKKLTEQAEIVTELVTALSFYLVDWSVDETIHQATIDFAIAAQEKARKAIAKAKGE